MGPSGRLRWYLECRGWPLETPGRHLPKAWVGPLRRWGWAPRDAGGRLPTRGWALGTPGGLPSSGSELVPFIPGGWRVAFGLHYLGCTLHHFSLSTEGLCFSPAPRRLLPHSESSEEASSRLLQGVRTAGPLRRCRLMPLPPGFSCRGAVLRFTSYLARKKDFPWKYLSYTVFPSTRIGAFPLRTVTVFQAFYSCACV